MRPSAVSARFHQLFHDIEIPECDYARSWNLNSTETWAIDEESVHQVGCVHTCQGLEFDYVGVIIGDDMRFEDGRIVFDHNNRATSDASLKDIKTIAKTDPERAQRIADEIIRNTYRVLMTRDMRGCYMFCTDKALAEHFRNRMPDASYLAAETAPPIAAEDSLED